MVYLPPSGGDYGDWVKAHPDGFVINVPAGNADMTWHQVGCGHIMPGGDWNALGHSKACSVHPGELAVWAKSRSQGLRYCTDCQSEWSKTHRS